MKEKNKDIERRVPFYKRHINQVIALLFIAGLIAYSNTFYGAFCWDDKAQILTNENIQELAYFSDLSVWTDVNNRPLSKLSFALNWYFGGDNVVGYHLVNLLLHLLTAVVAYSLARYTLSLLSPADGFDERFKKISALFVALLFLLHPLQTMAVTYIVQRMTVMAALFYLLAVFLYARGRHAYLYDGLNRRSMGLLLLALLSGVLGVMSKQNAVSFPLAFILYEIFFIRKPDGRYCKKYVFSSLAIFFAAFLVVVFAGLLPAETSQYTRLEYFSAQLGIFHKYLLLILFPLSQNVDYFIILKAPLFGAGEIIGAILSAGMLVLGVFTFRKNKLISFGIFWFFIAMSVESGIIPIRDIMMEHRMYLPMFGIGMVIAGIIMKYIPYRSVYVIYIAGTIIFMLLALGTYNRNKVWQSELTLWQDGIEKSPGNPRVMNNLGLAIKANARYATSPQQRINDLHKAISYFSKSMTGDTIFTQAYLHRGLTYLELEEYEKALLDVQRVASTKPKYAYMKLYIEGVILAKQGMLESALNNFNNAIDKKDDFAMLFTWRGLVEAEMEEYGLAIDDFNRSLEINPEQTKLCINISNLYFYLHDYGRALEWIRKAGDAGEIVDPGYLQMLESRVLIK